MYERINLEKKNLVSWPKNLESYTRQLPWSWPKKYH